MCVFLCLLKELYLYSGVVTSFSLIFFYAFKVYFSFLNRCSWGNWCFLLTSYRAPIALFPFMWTFGFDIFTNQIVYTFLTITSFRKMYVFAHTDSNFTFIIPQIYVCYLVQSVLPITFHWLFCLFVVQDHTVLVIETLRYPVICGQPVLM